MFWSFVFHYQVESLNITKIKTYHSFFLCQFFHGLCDTSWNVWGHSFGTISEFWRFPELLMTPSESSPRDLQSESGPGASGAQKNMKI